ncbi:MmgE/PrpD family protein [Microbacterium aerolatum]|uniref:MmgE/Prp family protein n=1 Tax=Microbacterium aerolatum TaxID=153731 RepID=A0A511AEF3_9MICO|nr:MmgE/PrpD family protein [Microbacterium aerolatum]GEK86412.1 MmgE/Prp family protein [Microbacterium aerolatum]GGB22662.1 MmgE/Prp family protein [Microbacterium aerolatum]
MTIGSSASHTRRLSSHVAEFPTADTPAAVIHAAKRSLLDGIGVSLAASSLARQVEPFIGLAREGHTRGGTPVIGCGFDTAPTLAATVNGALAHALDFEDTHDAAIVHPYAAAIPAALSAMNRIDKIAGRELLASLAHGANLVCRVSLGFTNNSETDGWFLHPILNSLAAAATASRVYGATSAQVEQALSFAFSQSTSSAAAKDQADSDYRTIREAFNAHAGVVGASLARDGLIGFSRVFDGPYGIYGLYGGGSVDAAALTGDLETRWENTAVSFKPWPSCRGTHAFVDCALQIMQDPLFSADEISDIEIRVSPFYQSLCEPTAEKSRPTTASAAKFSIPFVLAATVRSGELTLKQFDEWALADEQTIRLAERIRVGVDRSLDMRSAMNGGVKITLADGTVLRADVEEPRGGSTRPMDDAELIAKFRACAELALHPPRDIAAFVDLVMNFEQEPDAHSLLVALRADS